MFQAFPNAVGLACGKYVIVGIVLLRHKSCPLDLLGGTPIAPSIQVAEKRFQGILAPSLIFSIIKRVVTLRARRGMKTSLSPRDRTAERHKPLVQEKA
jgi:hypothetical protein